MAFKTINDFIGFDSLIPTLLVFRAYLYIIESNAPNFIVVKLYLVDFKITENIQLEDNKSKLSLF